MAAFDIFSCSFILTWYSWGGLKRNQRWRKIWMFQNVQNLLPLGGKHGSRQEKTSVSDLVQTLYNFNDFLPRIWRLSCGKVVHTKSNSVSSRVKNLTFMTTFCLRCFDDWFDFLEPFKKYLAPVSLAKIPAFFLEAEIQNGRLRHYEKITFDI